MGGCFWLRAHDNPDEDFWAYSVGRFERCQRLCTPANLWPNNTASKISCEVVQLPFYDKENESRVGSVRRFHTKSMTSTPLSPGARRLITLPLVIVANAAFLFKELTRAVWSIR